MRDDLDDEAYVAVLRSIENEITRIVGAHIPWKAGHERDDRMEMDFILFRDMQRLGTWDPKKTAEAWAQVCGSARELQRLWRDFDGNARWALGGLFSVAPFDNGRANFKATSRHDMAHFLDFGGDILGEVEKEGSQMLGAGRSAGRRNIRAVAVVDACRVVWERRTGRAPSISTRAFADFLAEIFEALEPLEFKASPEAAYKAWAGFVES